MDPWRRLPGPCGSRTAFRALEFVRIRRIRGGWPLERSTSAPLEPWPSKESLGLLPQHVWPPSQAFGTAGEPITARPQPPGRLRGDREFAANSCGRCGARIRQRGMWESKVRVGIAALGVGFQECHQSLKGVEPLARNAVWRPREFARGQMQVTGKKATPSDDESRTAF